MKLVIFGATGGTGLPLVQQALDAGHHVIAFVRSPHKLTIKHPNLTPFKGDAMNADDVQRAISADVDAVLSTLAPAKNSPATMLVSSARNILDAMHRSDVRRLIYMTGAGVPAPHDEPKFINHIIRFALKTFSGAILEQSEQAVDLIRASDRDWVIVRAPMLTNADYSGEIRVGWVGVNTGSRLARADAAAFMLQQLDSDAYLCQAPVISN